MGSIVGLIVCLFLIYFVRFSDPRAIYSISFFVITLEAILSALFSISVNSTGICNYYNIGDISQNKLLLNVIVVFVVDDISLIFNCILLIALLPCLFFLKSYFDYDYGGSHIMLLSGLFSQLAFLLFSSFDLFSIIFF